MNPTRHPALCGFLRPKSIVVLILCLVAGAVAAGTEEVDPKLRAILIPTPNPLTQFSAPKSEESLQTVRSQILQLVARIDVLTCTVELSEKREKKRTRKVKTGPLELARGKGGRVAFSRKKETDEYIANAETIWSYAHHEKKAQYIPTSMPVVGFFVEEAMKLNVFLSVDEGTLRFHGTQHVDGEPCWVLEGRSPSKLRPVGVPVSTVRVWVAKKDGIPRRIWIPSEDDLVVTLRDISINGGMDSGRFIFTPPEKVKVVNVFGL